MKLLHICTGWQVHRQYIIDNDVADAACKALTDAMAAYKEYSNDETKTVTIATGPGHATYRISQLVAVSMDDLEDSFDAQLKVIEWNKRIEAAQAERSDAAPTPLSE